MPNSTLDKINDNYKSDPIDVFICCASFEDRCLAIPKSLSITQIKQAVIFVNRDYLLSSKKNFTHLKRIFKTRNQSYELDTGNPLITADMIVEGLEYFFSGEDVRRIAIDITAFTRESMLIMLRYLHDHRAKDIFVEFLYSRAEEYSVGDPIDKKWLSSGHKEVRSVLGYSGLLLPTKQNHLIVLVGFEDERALTLVNECEPAKITLGIPDKSEWATFPHQDTNVDRLRRLKNIIGKVSEFTFSGYDAKSTKKSIQKIIEQEPTYNTIIAPMNTKISTIGAAMVALENKDVQICYSQAETYNVSNYSQAGDHFFRLSLDDIT